MAHINTLTYVSASLTDLKEVVPSTMLSTVSVPESSLLHKLSTVCYDIPVSCATTLPTLSTITTVVSVLLSNTTETFSDLNFTQPSNISDEILNLTTIPEYTTNLSLSNATFSYTDYDDEYEYYDANDTQTNDIFKSNYSIQGNLTMLNDRFYGSTEMMTLSTYSENETVSSATDNLLTKSVTASDPENYVLLNNNSDNPATKNYPSTEETICYRRQCSDVLPTTSDVFSDKSNYSTESDKYTSSTLNVYDTSISGNIIVTVV